MEKSVVAPKIDKSNVIDGIMKRTIDIRKELVGLDLSGIDFTPCQGSTFHLQYVNFEGTKLQGAVFTDVDMRFANLRNADITGADITRADLSRSTLGTESNRVKGLESCIGLDTALFHNISEICAADKAIIMERTKRQWNWKD
jgi:uncharacterized protein YjbI with pentapeptide repeats